LVGLTKAAWLKIVQPVYQVPLPVQRPISYSGVIAA